jgi:hypothetical protein
MADNGADNLKPNPVPMVESVRSGGAEQKESSLSQPAGQKPSFTARRKIPFWLTIEGRRLVLFGVLGISLLVIFIFGNQIWYSKPANSSNENKINALEAAKFVPKENMPSNVELKPFEGMLDDVKDNTPLDDKMFKEKGYAYLVHYLSSVKQEDLKQRSRVLTYDDFLVDSDNMRGQFVAITGLIIKSGPVRLPAPLPGGLDIIYRSYIVDPSGSEGYIVDTIEKPADFALRRDLVRVYGIFYKIATYEGKKGSLDAPLTLGIKVVRIQEAMAAASDSTENTMIALVAVIVVLVVGYFIVRLVITSKRSKIKTLPLSRNTNLS